MDDEIDYTTPIPAHETASALYIATRVADATYLARNCLEAAELYKDLLKSSLDETPPQLNECMAAVDAKVEKCRSIMAEVFKPDNRSWEKQNQLLGALE